MHASTFLLTLLALTTSSLALHTRGIKDQPWIGEFKSKTCSGGPVTNATLWDDEDAYSPGYSGPTDARPKIKGSSCVIWMPALPVDEASAIGISFGTGSRHDTGFDIYIGAVDHQCDDTGFVGTVFENGTATGDLAKSEVKKGGPGVCLVLDDTLRDMIMIKKHQ